MRSLPLLLLLLCVLPSPAEAHHSFSAEYDADGYLTLQGTIVEVRFRNPHVQYFMEVTGNGDKTRWNLAAQNVASLRRSGITADTIAVGDQISASGFPGRNGAKKLYVEVVRTAAGEEIAFFGRDTQRGEQAIATTSVAIGDSNIAAALIGDWAFDVDKPLPGAPLHLEFVQSGDGISAVLDNEELAVIVGEDNFSIVLDRENLAGFPAKLLLTGTVAGEAISGTVRMTTGYTNFDNLHAETFSARRTSAQAWQPGPEKPLQPVDITGVWTRQIGLGPIGRTNPHLNEAGQLRHAEYKKGLYDPTLRCLPSGPMRKYAQPGNIEIIATTNRLTMLYANSGSVRRLWFDREAHDPERLHDTLGESIASWDGATLVIDTRSLTETVLTHNSEPVSSDARIVERYSLDADGNLVMEATLHDAKYYARPVVRRMLMAPTDDTELIYSPCDPDSFYRALQQDGALDSYFENQPEPTPP
jgi:hypothetical protein